MTQYRDTYIETCREVIQYYEQRFGELQGILKVGNENQVEITWLFMLYLLNVVGSQTLTTRGSEKSLYGKFFEKLVLGSALMILGFDYVRSGQTERYDRVFWLSSQQAEERESDATLLYRPGQGVRFDIGFIGSGNTEISLDKVSRYRREAEIGNTHWFMETLIIVDRVGPRSKIKKLAEEVDGTIVQMSAGYWLKTIAERLRELLNHETPLLNMPSGELEQYIREKLADVPLMEFIERASGQE